MHNPPARSVANATLGAHTSLILLANCNDDFSRSYPEGTLQFAKGAIAMSKVILVTGANSGIGKVTARELAKAGATIILVCRDRLKGEHAVAEISRETGNRKLDLIIADLSDQHQIREVAANVRMKCSRLDVMINNAGAYNSNRVLTPDGYETTFAVNHLAYFLLTIELLDLLKASAPARIVNVASDAHRSGHLNFDDLHGAQAYSGWKAYAQSKLANIIFTYELARRLSGTNVTVNCMHPGAVASNFFENFRGTFGTLTRLFLPFMRSSEKGAETVIWLASSSEVEGVSGKYYMDCKERRSNPESYGAEVARRLWEVSEQLTHSRFHQ
jgi:NAD(P)-dependent dehydrogenase (short-subunit alcohol dehydrogenase family)